MKICSIVFSLLMLTHQASYLVAMELDSKQTEEDCDETITLACNDKKEISFPSSLVDISGTYQAMRQDELIEDKSGKYYCSFSADTVLLLKPLCNLIKSNDTREITKRLYYLTVDEIYRLIYLAEYFDIPLLLTHAKDIAPLLFTEHMSKIASSLKKPANLKEFMKDPSYVDTLRLSDNVKQNLAQILMDTNDVKKKILQEIAVVLLESCTISPPLQLYVVPCWRPIGKNIVWVSNNWLNNSWIWSENLEEWEKIPLHVPDIGSISWSADGQCLVAGMEDGTIYILNFNTADCIHKLQGHKVGVRANSCSLDGKYLASGSNDSTICIWDIQSGTCIYTYKPKNDRSNYYYIKSVSWSPNSKYLAVEINDETVNIHEISIDRHIFKMKNNYNMRGISWSPDSKYLVGGKRTSVEIWDIQSGECIRNFIVDDTSVQVVSWSPNGKYLAIGTEKGMYIHELITNECIFQNLTGKINGISWNIDGNCLAVVTSDSFKIWDTKNINILDSIDLKQALLLETLNIKSLKYIKRYNHLLEIAYSLPSFIRKIIDPTCILPLEKNVSIGIALSALLGGMGLSYSSKKALQHS